MTRGSAPARWRAAVAMARPIGCSLSASTAPARASSSPSSTSAAATVGEGHLPAGQGAGLVEDHGGDAAGPLQHLDALDEHAQLGPRPVPTMIAVGVASPSAHGQAMISTATAATRPACGSSASSVQPAKVARAMAITTGTNTPATRSARRWMWPLEAWASSTSRTIWARAVSAPTRVARTVSTPLVFTVAPGHRIANRLLDRHRLAGEHGLVDRAGAGHHLAVGGDLLARADAEQVAGHHLLDRDHDLLVVPHHPGLLGPQLEQGPDRLAGPALGPGLEVAAEDHEGDDHRGRLEVQVHAPRDQLGH